MWYVYVLYCKGGSLYTGVSNDVSKRYRKHKEGSGGRYTRSHPPVKILYKEALGSKSAALKREFEIKSWSRKEKIKKLNLNLKIMK